MKFKVGTTWPYCQLSVLETTKTHRVATTGEWEKLTQGKDFQDNSKIRMIEVMLPVFDAPQNLVKQAQLTAATNAKQ